MSKFIFRAEDAWRSKTTWTAIIAIVGALATSATGHLGWKETAAAIFAALQTAFLRDAFVTAARAPKETS